MKQTKYRFPLPVVALMVAVSLVGCAKEEPNPNNPDRMTIAPLASLGTSGVEAGSAHSSSAQTKAPVSVTDALDLYVARADQTSASAYGSYEATAITAARTAGTGSQTLTLNPVQYYLADGLKTKLTGWYPGGGTAVGDITGNGYYDGTNGTVSWTINGQQDVMTAPKQEGSWTSALPAMTFGHRLTQLQFYPYAETQETVDAWSKITRIEVLNQQNTVVYNLTNDATGAVSFSGAATNSFSVGGIAAGGATLSLSTTANRVTDAKQMGNPVMIVPQAAANHTLTLRIILANNTYKNVTLTGALTAGTPYRLYMEFTERDITIETTVAQWSDVTTTDNVGSVHIGDYLDGGIVYYVTDETNYKVVSVEEWLTPWAATNTYVVSGARSDTDGKKNSDAIRDYFEANPATVGNDFAVAFPAAAACYDYRGEDGADPKGTWYLPAKSELQHLWCAYNGKAPISWASDTHASAAADAAAQTVFNTYLTDAGGTGITGDYFWSSTENTTNPKSAWGVSFSDGYTANGAKTSSSPLLMRCIKHITPPPAVGNYYYADGSYSAALQAGKTATGVIYYIDPVDPTKFKVVSLEESSSILLWAKANTLVTSGARSDTDGNANSKAIRDYFETKITSLTFDKAFPAAAYCYNYTGKDGTDSPGTWYLPAKSELQYLWCVHNGMAPASWPSGNYTAIDRDAQKSFNTYLTAAGGAGISSGDYWSSTEYSSTTDNAWTVLFAAGSNTTNYQKILNGLVRCIRAN